jgi:hypothetical protein
MYAIGNRAGLCNQLVGFAERRTKLVLEAAKVLIQGVEGIALYNGAGESAALHPDYREVRLLGEDLECLGSVSGHHVSPVV